MKEDKLLQDLGKYLKSKGWKVVVIGFKGVVQGNSKYNYELIVSFTGKRINEKR